MSMIYPDWVGPTTEYRTASRFPHWIPVISGFSLPEMPEGFLGGVLVLLSPFGTEIRGGLAQAMWRRATQAAITIIPGLGAMMTEEPGVEVKDEDTGV